MQKGLFALFLLVPIALLFIGLSGAHMTLAEKARLAKSYLTEFESGSLARTSLELATDDFIYQRLSKRLSELSACNLSTLKRQISAELFNFFSSLQKGTVLLKNLKTTEVSDLTESHIQANLNVYESLLSNDLLAKNVTLIFTGGTLRENAIFIPLPGQNSETAFLLPPGYKVVIENVRCR